MVPRGRKEVQPVRYAIEGIQSKMKESKGLTVGVLGGGTMGIGIATVMVRAGHTTVMRDVTQERVDAALDGVKNFIRRSVDLLKMPSQDGEQAIGRLSGSVLLSELASCDVVVEAIYEDAKLKAEAFGQLDDICGKDTLFHTNTSTLSVTEIASGSRFPGRVVGTHYCNPAALMKLVEVVSARQTDANSMNRTLQFVQGLGKTTVLVKDSPGLIVNRFLIPFENSCVRALAAGAGTVESMDDALMKGLRYPLGVFKLLDIVGLDIHKAVSMSLYDQLHDSRFAPPPLVDQMIYAGELGRKSGKGFYSYGGTKRFGE